MRHAASPRERPVRHAASPRERPVRHAASPRERPVRHAASPGERRGSRARERSGIPGGFGTLELPGPGNRAAPVPHWHRYVQAAYWMS
ncbi:hypothetical protein GCM10014719_55400 [Planomonospora parontospora subsp. antibiotica]|nr:hypothetical protein GCM10014719_55400 [Planomonospora parontospora subsp. antibiotica]